MALDKDKLYARPALYRMGYTDARIDAAIASGELCQRLQFDVEEIWKDGQPHMKATRQSRPRTKHVALPPTATGGATVPVKQKKAAPAKKQEQPGELSLGLGL